MKYIVRFFPEIMVKGPSIKKRMVNQLYQNFLALFQRRQCAVTMRRYPDKFELFCEEEVVGPVERVLANTPGVDQFSQAVQYTLMADEPNEVMAEIARLVTPHMLDRIEGKMFAVRVKRTGTHAFTSNEIERFLGAHLIEQGAPAGVRLKHPDETVILEIHDQTLNVVTKREPGLGGFPIGSQGEVLSLMSGGFDSTVASFLSMKRGVKTHFVFFNLGGPAHEIGVKQVALYLWETFGASHRVSFVSVPFEGVVEGLFQSVHPSYLGMMLKRLMLQAAQAVAAELDVEVLVSGEAIGQVSSQTLKNLNALDQSIEALILRPLAMMDKADIIRLADRIGTRHFAESIPEYCGVISQNPVVNASLKRVEKEAGAFDDRLLEEAVANRRRIYVDQVVDDVNAHTTLPVVQVKPKGALVVDIRAPQKVAQAPLAQADVALPFYELQHRFDTLPAADTYLLYCDKGVMSQLHGQLLQDAGKASVKVYRPSD
jgi:thiamine biosynthesis protein ThiI